MASRNYWVPWYPKDALIALSQLKPDESAVLMQIINLIYAREEPIENDPYHIGKLCNMQRAKCIRIIESLVQKNQIYITEDGRISKNRCEEELREIRKKREKSSESGKKGAEKRYGIKENQEVSDGDAISDEMANTNTNKNQKEKTNTSGEAARQEGGGNQRPYSIQLYLSDSDLSEARKHAPKWDIYSLMRDYDRGINQGTREPPDYPAKAFIGWVKAKTKSKPPP